MKEDENEENYGSTEHEEFEKGCFVFVLPVRLKIQAFFSDKQFTDTFSPSFHLRPGHRNNIYTIQQCWFTYLWRIRWWQFYHSRGLNS